MSRQRQKAFAWWQIKNVLLIFSVAKKMENLPAGVWFIILSYLSPNDLIEDSATCKLFFELSRKNYFFNEKLLHSRLLFNNSRVIFDCYENAFLSSNNQLCFSLQKYVKDEDYFLKVREIIMSKLLSSALLFRVWNHMFLCERSQYCTDMCLYCTKLHISNKKMSDHINKNLCVAIEQFHASIREGIVIAEKIFIFAHTNIFIEKDDPFGRNFGSLYYESIRSPFLLWKMHLDTLCRIVFNIPEKFVLPVLISSVRGTCRSFTTCTTENCPGLKSKIIRTIFYKRLVEFCLYLIRSSCKNVNPKFIYDVYRNYKRGRDFFSCFLEFDRKWIVSVDG